MKKAPQQTAIILVDDHPLFRRGLRDVIAEDKRYKIVAEAGDGEQALGLIEQLKPRLAVLDVDMPNMTGLQVAEEILKRKLDTEVIFLTMHEDAQHLDLAMEAGAMGYVIKDSAAVDILRAIEAVLAGKNYVSPTLSRHLMRKNEKAKKGTDTKLGLSLLTATERKILKLISASKSTKQIADELYISTKTVSAHRSNICSKLNLHGTNALLKFALEHREKL